MSQTSPSPINSRHSRQSRASPLPAFSQPSPLNKVRQALNGLRDKFGFIPRDKLDDLMNREVVKEITMNLGLNDPSRPLHANALLYEEDYAQVHEKYRVILAILVELSWEEHFVKFHNYGNDDSKLPLSRRMLEHIDREQIICSLFLKRQYGFIPQTIGGEGRHSWPPEFVLPFVGDYKQNEIGDGGFSKVYKIELYPLYDNIKWTNIKSGQDEHIYALKQLYESDENAFMLETFACRVLGKRHHANLLPLLAYFKHGSSFNMIFPYADCDLRTYYHTHSPPNTAAERLQFMKRIHKLTSALKAIHIGGSDQSEHLVGYHRDLKPQNILIFNETFMIADFGLTLFQERDPGGKENSGFEWEFGVSTYRAPECDKAGMKVGRAGDVWSLGCILAEVITFAFTGLGGVLAFIEHRKAGTRETQMPGNQRMRDWFHDGEHVKPQVMDWFQYLVDSKNKDLFVTEFVCLLEKMLQSHPDDRLKISDVESEFKDILRREAIRPNTGISTANITSGVIRVGSSARSIIGMVTPERKNTEFVSTLYGESFPIERITTGSKTTESTLVPPLNRRNLEEYPDNGNGAISHFVQQGSLDDSISAPYRESLFSRLRVIMPWGWANQPVAPSGVENLSVRRRKTSNADVAELLASHHRSHFAPDHDFQDRDDQELTHDLLLPASRYNTSLQKTRWEFFSSSICGPADLQTLNLLNHWYPQENLSPKSASRPSNQSLFKPENQKKFRYLANQEDREEYRCEKCETRRIEREQEIQRIERENLRLGRKKTIKMGDKPVQDMVGVTVLTIMALIYLLLTLVVTFLQAGIITFKRDGDTVPTLAEIQFKPRLQYSRESLIFFITAVPLSGLTLGVWYILDKQYQKRFKRMREENNIKHIIR